MHAPLLTQNTPTPSGVATTIEQPVDENGLPSVSADSGRSFESFFDLGASLQNAGDTPVRDTPADGEPDATASVEGETKAFPEAAQKPFRTDHEDHTPAPVGQRISKGSASQETPPATVAIGSQETAPDQALHAPASAAPAVRIPETSATALMLQSGPPQAIGSLKPIQNVPPTGEITVRSRSEPLQALRDTEGRSQTIPQISAPLAADRPALPDAQARSSQTGHPVGAANTTVPESSRTTDSPLLMNVKQPMRSAAPGPELATGPTPRPTIKSSATPLPVTPLPAAPTSSNTDTSSQPILLETKPPVPQGQVAGTETHNRLPDRTPARPVEGAITHRAIPVKGSDQTLAAVMKSDVAVPPSATRANPTSDAPLQAPERAPVPSAHARKDLPAASPVSAPKSAHQAKAIPMAPNAEEPATGKPATAIIQTDPTPQPLEKSTVSEQKTGPITPAPTPVQSAITTPKPVTKGQTPQQIQPPLQGFDPKPMDQATPAAPSREGIMQIHTAPAAFPPATATATGAKPTRFDRIEARKSDAPSVTKSPNVVFKSRILQIKPATWSPPKPVVSPDAATAELRNVDPLVGAGRAEPASAQPVSMPTVAATRADLPMQIARQLAEVAAQMPNRPVDITLSPEELGRVRMSLTLTESGVVVSLATERPETMDLMRRHIDQLGQDFLSLGFEDIAFSFADQDADPDADPDSNHNASSGSEAEAEADAPLQIHLRSGATSGLDVRL